jgi:hypothetical protein
MTREQAAFVAELVHTVRPAWDTRAIVAALKTCAGRDLADTCHAAIRAAQNPSIEKPVVIGMDGNHWDRAANAPTHRSPTYTEICPKPGHSSWAANCSQCRSDALTGDPND